MDLSLALSPELDDGGIVVTDAALASPMSKHQRRLSLSAKWANNKALALEYLKRQREVIVWMERILGTKLPSKDLHESLKSGIVLRELLEKLFPDIANALSPISRNYSSRMAPWKERENISVFLKQCKALGMNDLTLFCTDDLYDGNNMVQDFMRFAQEHSGHLLLHPAGVYAMHDNDDDTFSNHEVEMALSKIEKAGVDASKLQEMMAGASSKSNTNDTDDETQVRLGTTTNEQKLPRVSEDCSSDDNDRSSDGTKALNALEDELRQAAAVSDVDSDREDDAADDEDDDSFDSALEEEADDDVEHEYGVEEDVASNADGNDADADDDSVFGDDEEEIWTLLVDLVGAVEDVHNAALERSSSSSGDKRSSDDDMLDNDADDDERKYSPRTMQLELDLEEAICVELPSSRVASEVQIETTTTADGDDGDDAQNESRNRHKQVATKTTNGGAKHRLESDARTELMDVGRSDLIIVGDAGAAGQNGSTSEANGSAAAAAIAGDASDATTSAKRTKNKKTRGKASKTKRKKSREPSSDEQLDEEAMSRCTCGGGKCTIM